MKKRNNIFIAVGTGFAIITLFLAFQLAPWFYASDTRVRLYLDAPAETEIDICWDEKQIECLPLVPFSEASNTLAKSGEVASVWLGDLPPRPEYHISLVYKSGFYGATFHELELNSSLSFGNLPGAGVGNIQASADQFISREISVKLINGVYSIESNTGGKLTLAKEIKPVLSDTGIIGRTTVKVWMLLFSIFLLFVIPLSLLPRAVENLGSAIKNTHLANYPWWVYLLCHVAAGFMLFLVVNSTVLLNAADPLGYLLLAKGGGWFNVYRLPGYPLFLGLALWLSGNSLNGVILFQALLLVISTMLCLWILRRWLNPFAAVLLVILCVISPAQVAWASWILRESLFASLVLLGITALIAHFTSRKPFSEIWLVIYAIICAVAFLVRENGILLPLAMLPFLVVEVIKRFMSPVKIWERLRSIFFLFAHYSIPVLAVGLVYVGFSDYNYLHYGYFQVDETQTSHHFLGRTLFSGNFDSRSLLYPYTSISEEAKACLGWPIYSSFILTKDQSPSTDFIHATLYGSVNQVLGARGLAYNTFHSASILDEIGKNSNSLVPWQADVASILRQYRMLMSSVGGYSLFPDDPATLAQKRNILSQYLPNSLFLEEKSSNPGDIITGYYNISQSYNWYGILYFLALLSSLYILWYKNPVFLAPIAFFLANDFLLLINRQAINPRYSESLDVLLILQIALGLSFWMYKRASLFNRIRLFRH